MATGLLQEAHILYSSPLGYFFMPLPSQDFAVAPDVFGEDALPPLQALRSRLNHNEGSFSLAP